MFLSKSKQSCCRIQILLRHRLSSRPHRRRSQYHSGAIPNDAPQSIGSRNFITVTEPPFNALRRQGPAGFKRPFPARWRNSTKTHGNHQSRPLSVLLSEEDPEEEEQDDVVFSMDEEIEKLAASSMNDFVDLVDEDYYTASQSHVDPALSDKQQRLRLEHSSLDLELGETSVWGSPEGSVVCDTQTVNVSTDTKSSSLPQQEFPEFPEGTAAAELLRQDMQNPNYNARRHAPSLSPLDILDQLSTKDNSLEDSLSYTRPLHSPSNKTDARRQSPQDLQQLQLQLECEAQREAVEKYQALASQARSRKDYASLNSLQKLILHWYQPVRNEIDEVQRQYIFKTARQKRKKEKKLKKQAKQQIMEEDADDVFVEQEEKENDDDGLLPGLHRHGPLISTIDPEKLAVIATHEALTTSILVSQDSKNHKGGCSVVFLAQKLGQAVEVEVLMQRVLKKHMEEEQLKESQGDTKKTAVTNDAVAQFADETLRPDGDAQLMETPFNYSESRLNAYLKQLAGDGGGNVSPKNRRSIAYAVRRARLALDTKEWTSFDRVQVGSVLLKIVLDNATIRLPDGTVQPAFRMERRWNPSNNRANANEENGKKRTRYNASNMIMVNDALVKLAVADEFESIAATTTRYRPMVIPPSPWTSPEHGGYIWLKTDLIRFHGSQMQREALDGADLTTVLDGLNSLSREAWIINKTILNIAQECWEKNIPLGDIPSRTDLAVPPEPIPPERTIFQSANNIEVDDEVVKEQKQQWSKEFKSFKEARNRFQRVLQKNRDMFSLRCSAKLKLGQAEQFKDYEKIYFPYNMDFRGRAYPVPPHLSNVGSDLSRGLLKFAKAKPLGKRGLFWLEVHLANLAGKDKMTFEDRAQYSRDNIDNVRKAVEDPFGRQNEDSDERPWWMGLDDPFQGLATCHEIINAIDSGNPETYMCSLPVHMDGSCNGLQHYAALGRDVVGGTAVNLCDYDEPQDVYIGVMEEVIRRVAEEAARDLDFDEESLNEKDELSKEQRKALAHNRSAKLVNGLIDRGVVKRTVMTSVYGVTYIGARQQIQEKIEEKLEEQGRDLDEINYEVFRSSGYLAEVTMNVIGDLFTGAKETMNWLTQCARLLSAKGYPVAWMTPLGLPAIQPYRQKRSSRITTALSSVLVADYSDDLPIHKSRSVSAFPPNYIHSLDSTHMLMTAMEMDRRGLSFSAVHDSFWTHPCDIDEMNDALRDMFVELYSQPLLEKLKQSFELRYPDITFPDLPEKGNLDLREVKKSTFFFQ